MSGSVCLQRVLRGLEAREALDVGCGTGEFTRTLARALGGRGRILGIDPDKDSLDEARRLTFDRTITYRMISVDEMPFREGRFDLVAMSNVLHHLPDPATGLLAMRRVAADGATVLVQELVSDALDERELAGRDLHHLKAWIDRLHGRVHEPTLTRARVRELVAGSGAVVEEECEVRDLEPADPGSERANDVAGFVADYLCFARGLPDEAAIRAEADRLLEAVSRRGIATPARLLIRARFPRRSDRPAIG